MFRKKNTAIVKKYLPKQEQFLLKAQVLDACRSVTANIAEGFGRFHYQENIRFAGSREAHCANHLNTW